MPKIFPAAILSAVLIGVAFAGTAAAADRPPTPAERTAIENYLRAQGYTAWEEIVLDEDGPSWDVDDAVWSDGAIYDLKLRPQTYVLIAKVPDPQ